MLVEEYISWHYPQLIVTAHKFEDAAQRNHQRVSLAQPSFGTIFVSDAHAHVIFWHDSFSGIILLLLCVQAEWIWTCTNKIPFLWHVTHVYSVVFNQTSVGARIFQTVFAFTYSTLFVRQGWMVKAFVTSYTLYRSFSKNSAK